MKKYKGKCKTKKAAEGLVNQEVAPTGNEAPAQAQPQGQPGGQPAVSIMIQPVVNMNGQTQQLDQLTLQSKDDIPKLSQYLMQVFDTVLQGGGGEQGGGGQQMQ